MQINLDKWSPSQQAAIVTRGSNVLVSAGAGSGKTSVLVERVVSCLHQHPPLSLSQLLVVTFTEAAAAEMRNRIAKRLRALADEALAEGHHEQARYFSHQLALLETAQISTLHSFCMRIVKNNFLYLGLEPRFRILDDNESLLMRTAILQGLLDNRLSGPDGEATRGMMRQFRLSDPNQMSKLVFRIDGFSVSQQSPHGWLRSVLQMYEEVALRVAETPVESSRPEPGLAMSGEQPDASLEFSRLPWTQGFMTFLKRSLIQAEDLLASSLAMASRHPELTKLTQNLTEMIEYVDTARQELTAFQLTNSAQALQAAMRLRWPRTSDHPLKQLIKDRRDEARDKLGPLAEIVGRGARAFVSDIVELTPAVRELVEVIVEFQESYQVEKRRRGVLDFHDLEHYAYQVLTDPQSGESERLQEQFVEVFVDEYQDTSPIQDAIVRAIGRPQGNVFTVGDVKQSIYRFRMAEPQLFLDQYQALGTREPGRVIDLVENYRSRPEVVEAVNFFFQQLFTEELGGIRYDEKTWMRAGASYPAQDDVNSLAGPVELHLVSREGRGDFHVGLENRLLLAEETPLNSPESTPSGPAWEASGAQEQVDDDEDAEPWDDTVDAEREALVVARKISEFMGTAPGSSRKHVWDASKGVYRPLQYRDIVILLRSAKASMGRFLEVFEGFSIPAYGATSTGFYGALEVRWLLAALSTIDNPRQEIDLVALLRSPLIGFTDVELARLRTMGSGNLWDVMERVQREISAAGPSDADLEMNPLRERVRGFLGLLGGWRRLARRAGAQEVIRAVLQDTGFLAYVSAMPFGAARKANVELFLDYSRLFDKTSVEGVFGFISEAKKRLSYNVDVGEARTLGESEDVVRLMTIHQSKGLEFPVVFIVGLGKLFHLGKDEQTFLLHRSMGFGPQVLDARLGRRWWTMPGFAIREAELSESLAEEVRILYVALTRAREKLVLVGSMKQMETQLQKHWEKTPQMGVKLPYHILMQARSFLDWLIPAVLRHREAGAWRRLAGVDETPALLSSKADFSLVHWNCPGGEALPTVPDSNMAGEGPSLADAMPFERSLETLEENQPGSSQVEAVLEDLQWVDTNRDRFAVPGKISATDLRRLWVAGMTTHPAHSTGRRAAVEGLLEDPEFVDKKLSGRTSGIAFHAVMQHLDLGTEPNVSSLRLELERLVARGLVSEEQFTAVDLNEIVDFLTSDLGRRVAQARRVWREQPFFHRLDLAPADMSRPEQDFVLVQGIIDCLAEEQQGWLIVDYKTDQVGAADVPQKTREYEAQVAAYQEVVQSLARDSVGTVESYIYFVKPRVAVRMSKVDLRRLFDHASS